MKIDLESDEVTVLETTVGAVRAYFDGKEVEEILPGFETALDNAQGEVFDEMHETTYVVIKVTR